MIRTREIEVLIYDNGLRNSIQRLEKENEWINVHSPLSRNIDKTQMIKAKLIIELPERKVTISESEFDEALSQVFEKNFFAKDSAFYSNIKEKLFKDA